MKILIIGQAPPLQEQKVPYDTTMLYDWFKECGITKEQAQDMFEFDAVYNKFPGRNAGGGHKVPTEEQMDEYWPVLKEKIAKAKKVIVLGNTARKYLDKKTFFVRPSSRVLYMIHPSKMNTHIYTANKEKIIDKLKTFLK